MLTKFMEKDLIELNKVMEETRWIICPECGGKTRVKIKETTIMKDFLLFCHHCKKEFTVDVENFVVKVVKNDKQSQN